MTKKSSPAILSDNPSQTGAKYFQSIMPYLSERGKIIGCADNLKVMLDIMGIKSRYNVISKQMELIIPDTEFSLDNQANSGLAWIASQMKKIGMETNLYREFLCMIADENQYNPVQQWIESKPWDGTDRLKSLFNTIESKNKEAKEAFIYRWLIGAVALACSPNGIDSSGILVLQGNQGLGKTWWFRKLVPQNELPNVIRADATINPHDKDSVSQAISSWLVELGELDATFKRSEIAALKSFITREFDIFRRPFMPSDSKFPRRTAFMASVNPVQYLTDETGNRRFWTIACTKVDSYHKLPMQQVWAEVYHCWRDGESWQLNEKEKQMLSDINEDHITNDPVVEMIMKEYRWETEQRYWRWMTATEILRELQVNRITKAELRTCSQIVRRLNGDQEERKNHGRMLLIPEKKGMVFNGKQD